MEYVDIDGDNFIEYDLETRQSRLLSKSKIEEEISVISEQLSSIPEKISDEELLKWAKENYYSSDYRSREVLESSVVVLEGKLSELTEKASLVTISSVTLKDRE